MSSGSALTVRVAALPGAGAAPLRRLVKANINLEVVFRADLRRRGLRAGRPGQRVRSLGRTRRTGRGQLPTASGTASQLEGLHGLEVLDCPDKQVLQQRVRVRYARVRDPLH